MAVLVSCGDGIGNIIQTTPLLRALESLGEPVDVYLYQAVQQAVHLFKGHGGHLRKISSRPAAFSGRRYKAALRTWLCPFPHGIQADKKLEGLHPCTAQVSEAQAALDMAITLGYSPQNGVPSTICAHEAPDWIDMSEGRWLAIHGGGKPAPGWLFKRLPPERYGEICEALLDEYLDLQIVVVGTLADDRPDVDHGRIHDMRGRGTLLEQIGTMVQAKVFLGNDAGLGHCAAAVGTPSVILYGVGEVRKNLPPRNATPVAHWDLECRPCQIKGKIECQRECMTDMPLESILDAVRHLL